MSVVEAQLVGAYVAGKGDSCRFSWQNSKISTGKAKEGKNIPGEGHM